MGFGFGLNAPFQLFGVMFTVVFLLFIGIFVATATMTPIDFLILDEHTAALDPKTAEIVMELTNKVVQEKKLTTLMVTHNLRHAVTYGDRILMMHQGGIVLDKSGAEKASTEVDDLLDIFNSISIECGN